MAKKNSGSKKGKSTSAKADEALKKVNALMKAVETHYCQTQQQGQDIDYNGFVYQLSNISSGVDEDDRTGTQALGKWLDVRFDLLGASGGSSNVVRVIFFVDKDCQGTAPLPLDVLELTGASNAVNSPFNKDNLQRFQILKDYHIDLNTQGEIRKAFHRRINLRNKKIDYSGPNGTDEKNNQIYMLTIGDTITTNLAKISYYTRLGFKP